MVSTANTEHVFSDFSVTHTQCHNQLSSNTVHKISVVWKQLHCAHAVVRLFKPWLKWKLTPSGLEPSQASTTSKLVNLTFNSDANNTADFDVLEDVLAKSAIDLWAQLETESDFNSEVTSEGGEPLVAILQALSNQSQPGKFQKDLNKTMHLMDLFLYLHAPLKSASDADKKVFDASINGDCLRHLCLI